MKPTSTLVVRLDAGLKSAFIELAKQQESDASKEIRKFIKQYVQQNSQKEMKL